MLSLQVMCIKRSTQTPLSPCRYVSCLNTHFSFQSPRLVSVNQSIRASCACCCKRWLEVSKCIVGTEAAVYICPMHSRKTVADSIVSGTRTCVSTSLPILSFLHRSSQTVRLRAHHVQHQCTALHCPCNERGGSDHRELLHSNQKSYL